MESTEKNLEDILKWIIVIILCFVIVLIIFITGVFVGQEKARNFGEPVYGTFGLVVGIDNNSLIIKCRGDMKKIITVSKDTLIVNQRHQISLRDVRIGNSVVIVGELGTRGLIEAKLIRVFLP